MTRTPLDRGWTMHPRGPQVPPAIPQSIPAAVPGTVHTDLLAAGLIPDPYLDRNEQQVAWIGESDFSYRTTFAPGEVGPHERIELVAEGLDTVATVTVNGQVVGTTRNQHRSYRFDLRDAVLAGDNELRIDFASALRFAREAEQRLGVRPFVGNALPYNAIRKMACNFGWDWGPVLVTAGIWRPIHLHRWSTARIERVVPTVDVDADGNGTVRCAVDLDRTDDARVDVRAVLTAPDGTRTELLTSTTGTSFDLVLSAADVALWWPRGHGDQPLYSVHLQVSHEGEELDAWSHDVGFRTVEVKVEPDEFGTSFAFWVNGRQIFVKGANWIPDDCFLPRVGRQEYETGIGHAVDAGMNLLRVWGGGIYESDDFYDICNRRGILVWQDFLFACAAYSEAPELWDEVAAEAREQVVRLAPNPSLVLWNGSNENVEGYYHWGWKDQLADDEDWGRGYYDDLLPGIVAELDPGRPYLPSSPFNPREYSAPRDPDHGPVHSWEVWNRADYTAYRQDIPRFVSEFGFQAPPSWATLTRAVHDDPLRPDSPGVLSHQKADDGNGKLQRGYTPHLPAPTTPEAWHFATQLNQARAITYGVEHFRSYSPRTAGYIIWQLNDCWPVISWSAVDGDGRRKPLWYALKALNADRLLTIQPRPDGLSLVVSNDSPDPWSPQIRVRRVTLDGITLAEQRVTLELARGNGSIVLDEAVAAADDPRSELIVASVDGARRAYWYFAEDTELNLPAPDISAEVDATATGVTVTVTAGVFVKDLVLNADRLHPDARADDQLVTLLPGTSHVFTIESLPDPSSRTVSEQLRNDPHVLWSVNSLAHPRASEES